VAGSSSWPRTTSTDLRQLSLGWPDVRLHIGNRILVAVVMQGAAGLEKSRAAAGRERRRPGRVADGSGENAGVVDLSRAELNMNGERNYVN
jgi:hypothetical protein